MCFNWFAKKIHSTCAEVFVFVHLCFLNPVLTLVFLLFRQLIVRSSDLLICHTWVMCPFYFRNEIEEWKGILKECFKVLAKWMTGRVFFLVLYNPPILALSVRQKHQHYLMEILFWIRFSPALLFCNHNNIYDQEIVTDHKSGSDNDFMLTLDDIDVIWSHNVGHLIIGNYIKWHVTAGKHH